MSKSNSAVKVNTVLQYCYHNQKGDLSNKYEVILSNLSDAAVAKLAAIGIEAKTREERPDWGQYISVKSNYPISITDQEGQEIDPSIKIGNGTKAIALVDSYEWSFKKKSGISPSVNGIVVTELVEFETKESILLNSKEEAV